jgi:DNA-binding MarR family transcriptional regulator
MSAETFNDALEQFFRAMRQARVKPAATAGSLTMPQMVLILPLLDGDRPCSVRELADAAGIASPTATRTLDGLERDGLILRRPSEADRRSVLVELTAEGRRQAQAAREIARAARVELYGKLERGEREEAEAMLRRLTEIIRAI